MGEQQTSDLPPMSLAEFIKTPAFASLTPQQQQEVPQRYVDTFGKSIAQKAAEQYGLDPDIFARQIQQESNWKNNAVSPVGARGLLQFMPATAKEQHVNPRNPDDSIYGAAQYMRQLIDQLGSKRKGLAAYNAGAKTIKDAINEYGEFDWERGIPQETKDYLAAIVPSTAGAPAAPQPMSFYDFAQTDAYKSLTPEQKQQAPQRYKEVFGSQVPQEFLPQGFEPDVLPQQPPTEQSGALTGVLPGLSTPLPVQTIPPGTSPPAIVPPDMQWRIPGQAPEIKKSAPEGMGIPLLAQLERAYQGMFGGPPAPGRRISFTPTGKKIGPFPVSKTTYTEGMEPLPPTGTQPGETPPPPEGQPTLDKIMQLALVTGAVSHPAETALGMLAAHTLTPLAGAVAGLAGGALTGSEAGAQRGENIGQQAGTLGGFALGAKATGGAAGGEAGPMGRPLTGTETAYMDLKKEMGLPNDTPASVVMDTLLREVRGAEGEPSPRLKKLNDLWTEAKSLTPEEAHAVDTAFRGIRTNQPPVQPKAPGPLQIGQPTPEQQTPPTEQPPPQAEQPTVQSETQVAPEETKPPVSETIPSPSAPKVPPGSLEDRALQYAQKEGRLPTVSEIEQELGVSFKRANALYQMLKGTGLQSRPQPQQKQEPPVRPIVEPGAPQPQESAPPVAPPSTPETPKEAPPAPSEESLFLVSASQYQVTPADIHAIAAVRGIESDGGKNPAFGEWTKQLTNKEHLDEMNHAELRTVAEALARGEKPPVAEAPPAAPVAPKPVQTPQETKPVEAVPTPTPQETTSPALPPLQPYETYQFDDTDTGGKLFRYKTDHNGQIADVIHHDLIWKDVKPGTPLYTEALALFAQRIREGRATPEQLPIARQPLTDASEERMSGAAISALQLSTASINPKAQAYIHKITIKPFLTDPQQQAIARLAPDFKGKYDPQLRVATFLGPLAASKFQEAAESYLEKEGLPHPMTPPVMPEETKPVETAPPPAPQEPSTQKEPVSVMGPEQSPPPQQPALPEPQQGIASKDLAPLQEPPARDEEKIAKNFRRWLTNLTEKHEQQSYMLHVLDELEEQDISPISVVRTFWDQTYPALPPTGQEFFRKHISTFSGQNLDTPEELRFVFDPDYDVPSEVDRLQGEERGLVALMEMANQRQKTPSSEPAQPALPALPPAPPPAPRPQTVPSHNAGPGTHEIAPPELPTPQEMAPKETVPGNRPEVKPEAEKPAPVPEQKPEQTLKAEPAPITEQPAVQSSRPAVAPHDFLMGNAHPVTTEKGTKLDTRLAIAEANNLIPSHTPNFAENPQFPQELQPRDRGSGPLRLQVEQIANAPDPARLGATPTPSPGAPIVGEDRVVESGNGRTMGLAKAYERGKAGEYKQWLVGHAKEWGIDPQAVEGMQAPILVRVRQTPVNRVQFAQESNYGGTAGMSPRETAFMDARNLTPEMIRQFVPADDGTINTAQNQGFIKQFFQDLVPQERWTDYYMQDGSGLNTAGIQRVRNAILAKAYGDPDLITRLAEDPNPNIRNVLNALVAIAPRFARLQERIDAGALYPLNIAHEIAHAANMLATARAKGQSVEQVVNSPQGSLFGKPQLDPLVKDLLFTLERYLRSGKQLGHLFRRYLDAVDTYGDPRQHELFGPKGPTPTKADVLGVALTVENETHGQAALFSDKPTGTTKTTPGALPTPPTTSPAVSARAPSEPSPSETGAETPVSPGETRQPATEGATEQAPVTQPPSVPRRTKKKTPPSIQGKLGEERGSFSLQKKGPTARDLEETKRIAQAIGLPWQDGKSIADQGWTPKQEAQFTAAQQASISPSQTGMSAWLKKNVGTLEHEMIANFGPEDGRKIAQIIQEAGVKSAVTAQDVQDQYAKLAYDLNPSELAERLSKLPVFKDLADDLGAAGISRWLQKVGLDKGVSDADKELLFKSVESIKDLDENGDPIFGTHIYEQDEEGGRKLVDANGDPDPNGQPIVLGPRYTAEQGQQMWDEMTPAQQAAAKWYVADREVIRQLADLEPTIEGYIHHFFEGKLKNFLHGLTSRTVRLQKRTAGPAHARQATEERLEVPGYVKDFFRAGAKGTIELKQVKIFNDMIKKLALLVTRPLGPGGQVFPGWHRIPKTGLSRRGKIIGNLMGGRQMPLSLYKEWKRYVEPIEEQHRVLDALGAWSRYSGVQLLIHPGTQAKNAIASFGIQYATYAAETLMKGMVSGGNFKPFLYAIAGPFDALRPSTMHALPGSMLGGNAVDHLMKDHPGLLQQFNTVATFPQHAVDNWVKRSIMVSSLRAQGVPIDRDTILSEKKAFNAAMKAMDVWGLNYQALNTRLSRLLGQPWFPLIALFPKYAIKAAHMLNHSIGEPFSPDVEPDARFPGMTTAQERAARWLTSGMILGFLYYMYGRWRNGTTDLPIPGAPSSVSTRGRIQIGKDKQGAEEWLNVSDQPWFNLLLALNYATNFKQTGVFPTADFATLAGANLPHGGALLAGINLATSLESDRHDTPLGVRAAEFVKPLLPYPARAIEDYKKSGGGPVVRNETGWQVLADTILLPRSVLQDWVGLGKLVTETKKDPLTEKTVKVPVIKDPTLEQDKFYFGWNVKKILTPDFLEKRGKAIDSAMKAIGKAQTTAEFDTARRTLQQADPKIAEATKGMTKVRIPIHQSQKQVLDLWQKMPAHP